MEWRVPSHDLEGKTVIQLAPPWASRFGTKRASGNDACVRIRIKMDGAPTRTRTADLLITNQLLYQLSYRGAGRWHTQITEILQVKIRAFSICLFQKCEAV